MVGVKKGRCILEVALYLKLCPWKLGALLFVRRAAFICRRQSIRRAVVKVIEVHCQISIQIQSRSNGSARAGAGRGLLPRPCWPFPLPVSSPYAPLRSHFFTTDGPPRSSLCIRLRVRRRLCPPSSKTRTPLPHLRSCQNKRADRYTIIGLATAFSLYPRGRTSRRVHSRSCRLRSSPDFNTASRPTGRD